ncbi:MAG: cache domain-containing protein, partial [Anaerovoracaceae bacterium]
MKENEVLWKNRLSVKIPIIMAIGILIVILVMCSCLNWLTRATVTDMTEKELDYIAEQNANVVGSYLESMLTFSQALSLEVQRYQNLDRESANNVLIESLKGVLNNDKIFSAYYAFEPNKYFADTPDGLSYYAYRDGSDIGIDVFYDYDSYGPADYYATTKEKMETHVTEPYSWELSNGEVVWLVTLSSPVVDGDGNFIGVANCDINVGDLQNLAYNTGGYESSYSYTVTSLGTCLAHTLDESVVGTVPQTVSENEEILKAISEGKTVSTTIANPYDKNKKAYIIHNDLRIAGTDVDWSSAFVINKSEALNSVKVITLVMIAIGVAGLLILIFISSRAVKRGLKPVEPVMELAEKMGRCDLSVSEENLVTTNDELGVLADIFNETSKTLNGYIADVSDVLGKISEGNLDVNIKNEFIGDFNIIKEDINQIL